MIIVINIETLDFIENDIDTICPGPTDAHNQTEVSQWNSIQSSLLLYF